MLLDPLWRNVCGSHNLCGYRSRAAPPSTALPNGPDYRLHGEQMTPIPVYSLLESFKVPGAINCLRAPSANHFQRDRQEGMWPRIRPSYRERERLLFQYPKKQRGRPSVTGEGSVGLLERATCAGGVIPSSRRRDSSGIPKSARL